MPSSFWLELVSAKAIITWCVVSAYLGQRIVNIDIYEAAFNTAPPWFWQVGGIGLGVLQLLGLWTDSKILRISVATLTGSYWFLLAYCIRFVDENVLGIIFYVELAFINGVAMIALWRRWAHE